MRDRHRGRRLWKPPADGHGDRSTASSGGQQIVRIGEPWQGAQINRQPGAAFNFSRLSPVAKQADIRRRKLRDQKSRDHALHLPVSMTTARADDLAMTPRHALISRQHDRAPPAARGPQAMLSEVVLAQVRFSRAAPPSTIIQNRRFVEDTETCRARGHAALRGLA